MAQKISVVIPNYNGSQLLAANMPNVLANSVGSEIIVVDDASTDDSVKLLKKRFKKVKVIQLRKNHGFSYAVNTGVRQAGGKLVALLNSDVSPRKNYLRAATNHFKNNKNIFAVGFMDYSHEHGKIVLKGRGSAFFSKGFILHRAAPVDRGETFWVSGGSSLVNKHMFEQLGGFDEIYKPFYWEDIDLGFKAKKAGLKLIFEPLSVVDHHHEQGAIATQKSPEFVKTVSYKNQFLFFWKNITDIRMCVVHLIYLRLHIVRALFSLDVPFFKGFIWATSLFPRLIVDSFNRNANVNLTDRDIFYEPRQ